MTLTPLVLSCRICEETLNAWTPVGSGHLPTPGDAAMCINCGAVSVFDGTRLREPTMDEMQAIVTSPGYQHARHALAYIMGEQG